MPATICVEGALAAHGVVLVGVHAVERDAQVERVARAVEGGARAGGGVVVEEGAVGEHGERPARERLVDERPELGVHHRLAAGEVVVARAERLRLGEEAAHVGGGPSSARASRWVRR